MGFGVGIAETTGDATASVIKTDGDSTNISEINLRTLPTMPVQC